MTLTDSDLTESSPLAQLADRVAGPVHLPGTEEYLVAAMPWNVAVASFPAAVLEAETADDVVAAIRFANEHGLEVGVRATGHGAFEALENVLLLRTNRLDELTVHPEGWARVGAGVKWAQVIEAAAPYGLAPLAGSAPDVGVVGYLTGGGIGPLARTYGVSADYVRAIEVVTGDGELHRATATDNPALFWALRGGKGALGIITAIEFDLVRQPTIYGGALFFDGADTAAVMRTWAEWCLTLPEQATTSIAILRLPDAPFVPPPLAGRMSVTVRFVWTGDPAEGEQVFAPMAAVAAPIFGQVGVMPYTMIGLVHADPVDPMPVHEHAALLREFGPDTVDALLPLVGPAADCPQVIVEVRQLGGAVARFPENAGALSYRDSAYTFLTIGIKAGPGAEATVANAEQIGGALAPWSTGHAMPNWAPSGKPEDVARTYDRETLTRLVTLSATYDPKSVIRAARPMREALALSS
ncbi:FAD-binding oxidoreductase [Naasia sp. SYSU D00948]|uniref:FAD-binding oxidoreductase n=1 Tax=Naasia sp. SYSU D00948 TaxID=2817379 RepID=UPI001B304876|nr:FAD-binding oxidoreductase [Naasia sp. SYSU D00948]